MKWKPMYDDNEIMKMTMKNDDDNEMMIWWMKW